MDSESVHGTAAASQTEVENKFLGVEGKEFSAGDTLTANTAHLGARARSFHAKDNQASFGNSDHQYRTDDSAQKAAERVESSAPSTVGTVVTVSTNGSLGEGHARGQKEGHDTTAEKSTIHMDTQSKTVLESTAANPPAVGAIHNSAVSSTASSINDESHSNTNLARDFLMAEELRRDTHVDKVKEIYFNSNNRSDVAKPGFMGSLGLTLVSTAEEFEKKRAQEWKDKLEKQEKHTNARTKSKRPRAGEQGSKNKGKQKTRKQDPVQVAEEQLHEDYCYHCRLGGELLMCDFCDLVFHLGCLNPPLSKIPEGDWSCPKCTEERKKPTPHDFAGSQSAAPRHTFNIRDIEAQWLRYDQQMTRDLLVMRAGIAKLKDLSSTLTAEQEEKQRINNHLVHMNANATKQHKLRQDGVKRLIDSLARVLKAPDVVPLPRSAVSDHQLSAAAALADQALAVDGADVLLN
eukprot:m.479253 g.479253  ORF g.479253 m.479253 type:complete len:462 (-) comp21698_c0_seq10:242-1627(-)